jgi:hypothetical protein
MVNAASLSAFCSLVLGLLGINDAGLSSGTKIAIVSGMAVVLAAHAFVYAWRHVAGTHATAEVAKAKVAGAGFVAELRGAEARLAAMIMTARTVPHMPEDPQPKAEAWT